MTMTARALRRGLLLPLASFVTVCAVGLNSRIAGADDAPAPPPLTLTVTPDATGGPWKLRIENTGDTPLLVAADPRLLVLEVMPPAAASDTKPKPRAAKPSAPVTLRCILPTDARPPADSDRELVIPGKRSWSTVIDPRFFCFGPRERAALVAGATVKARFGWPAASPAGAPPRAAKPKAPTPPFVATPVGAAVGKIASAKEIEGNTFTLGDTAAAAPSAPTDGDAATATRTSLVVSMPETLDVARGVNITTSVTVANTGDKPVTTLFRPETLRFIVSGPSGSVACGSTRMVGSPIRELYSTLAVKGRASTSLLLTAACPSETFDEAGMYRVIPILDTTGASGRSVGLKTWDGEATGSAMLLRVRAERDPSAGVGAANRPSLD